MSKHSRLSVVEAEGIDAIIDSVAADPKNAAYAKSILHEKIKARRAVVSFPPSLDVANDDEDLWDNMPV